MWTFGALHLGDEENRAGYLALRRCAAPSRPTSRPAPSPRHVHQSHGLRAVDLSEKRRRLVVVHVRKHFHEHGVFGERRPSRIKMSMAPTRCCPSRMDTVRRGASSRVRLLPPRVAAVPSATEMIPEERTRAPWTSPPRSERAFLAKRALLIVHHHLLFAREVPGGVAKTRLYPKSRSKRPNVGCVAASDDAFADASRATSARSAASARATAARSASRSASASSTDRARGSRAVASNSAKVARGSRRGRLIWRRRRGRRWRRPRGLARRCARCARRQPRRARRQPRRGVFRARRRRCWPGEGGGRAHPPRAPETREAAASRSRARRRARRSRRGGFEGGGGGGRARGVVGGEERGGEGVELLAREGRAEEPADPRGVERKVRGGRDARGRLGRLTARGREREGNGERARGRDARAGGKTARERARQRARRRHGRETIRSVARSRCRINAKRRGRREGRIPPPEATERTVDESTKEATQIDALKSAGAVARSGERRDADVVGTTETKYRDARLAIDEDRATVISTATSRNARRPRRSLSATASPRRVHLRHTRSERFRGAYIVLTRIFVPLVSVGRGLTTISALARSHSRDFRRLDGLASLLDEPLHVVLRPVSPRTPPWRPPPQP